VEGEPAGDAALDAVVGESGLRGFAARVGPANRTWRRGAGSYLVYSVTKSFVGALFVRLAETGALDLDDPLARWLADARVPAAVTLRHLLLHTSGVPDYARVPEYAAAVRASPGRPWSDEELLGRALAVGVDFAPGDGWAYSNTGYLLLRQVAERVMPAGLDAALRAHVLEPLGLRATRVAEEPSDLLDLVPGTSAEVGEGVQDVRGRYHPRWVGHRALVSTADDLHLFWSAVARGAFEPLVDPARFVSVGFDAPGFARAGYGLGVMADPESDLGVVVGHGGGGPGYGAGCFAAVVPSSDPVVAVLLASGDGKPLVQETALRLLRVAVEARR
jgi:D-alanyl-D-alanine carboxypeptidase